MKRRIRYMALLLVLCMLALTGCAQPRDTMTLRVCLDAAPATLDPAMPPPEAARTGVAHLFQKRMTRARGEDAGSQPVNAAAKAYTVRTTWTAPRPMPSPCGRTSAGPTGRPSPPMTLSMPGSGWRTRPPAPPMRLC